MTSDEKRARVAELLAIGQARVEARAAAGLPPLVGPPDPRLERVQFLMSLGDERRERIEAISPEAS